MLGWVLQNFKTVIISIVSSAVLYILTFFLRGEASFAEVKDLKKDMKDMQIVLYTVNAQYSVIAHDLKDIKKELKDK